MGVCIVGVCIILIYNFVCSTFFYMYCVSTYDASMSICGNFMCIVCMRALFVYGHVFMYFN